jgi:hypothetical protein
MAARRGVIVDRHGNPIDDEDFDGVVPDGYAVRVSAMLMDSVDSVQRAVMRDTADPYEIDDALAQRIFDARAAYKARISAGMHRHRVALEPDTGDAHKERRSDSALPSSLPPLPRGDLIADAEARRAGAYANFKDRLHTAGPRRSPSPSAGDAASERRAHIERLQRAFARER